MEYIKIDDEKILLSLSAEDMAEYHDSKIKAIRKIMSDVQRKYGCLKQYGRIFVQIYESKGGGCELFVTKLRERRDTMSAPGQINERMLTECRNYIIRDVRTVYEFNDMESMLLCCKMLSGSGYSGKSESYADRERGKYYLVINGESSYPAEAMGEICPSAMISYLTEHCTKLFGEHAVGVLGRLAQ